MADPTLHERLLALTEPLVTGQMLTTSNVNGPRAALRAVVELHRPVTFWRPYNEPQQCYSCRSDRTDTGTVPWPCSTVQAIAGQLGLPTTEGEPA